MNIDKSEILEISKNDIKETEKTERVKDHVLQVGKYIEKYQFNLGAESIREFFWHELCDIWIEEAKKQVEGEPVGSVKRIEVFTELLYVLKENLKIMHPFIPFVTEAVWQELVNLDLAEGVLMAQQLRLI
jgi:valyl-tRNA synthetase